MTKRGPKAYSEEFRREAVRLAEAGTKPLTQIARELGIHLETLRGWRRQARRGSAGGGERDGAIARGRESPAPPRECAAARGA